jgi:hypothetical protein
MKEISGDSGERERPLWKLRPPQGHDGQHRIWYADCPGNYGPHRDMIDNTGFVCGLPSAREICKTVVQQYFWPTAIEQEQNVSRSSPIEIVIIYTHLKAACQSKIYCICETVVQKIVTANRFEWGLPKQEKKSKLWFTRCHRQHRAVCGRLTQSKRMKY